MPTSVADKIQAQGEILMYKAMITPFNEMSSQFETDGVMNKSKLTIKTSFISKFTIIDALRKIAIKPSDKANIAAAMPKTDAVAAANAPLATAPAPATAPTQQSTPDASLDALLDPTQTPLDALTKKGDEKAKSNFKKLQDYIIGLKPTEFTPPLPEPIKNEKTGNLIYDFPTNAAIDNDLADPRRSGRIIELAAIGEVIPVNDPAAFLWFAQNGPKYGFIVYLNKGLYYVGQDDIKNKLKTPGDGITKQDAFKNLLNQFLTTEGKNSLDSMIANGNLKVDEAISAVESYTPPPAAVTQLPNLGDGVIDPLAGKGSVGSKVGNRILPGPTKNFHMGLDIGAAYGTPIYACADGTVTQVNHGGAGKHCFDATLTAPGTPGHKGNEDVVNCGGSFGNYVRILHDNGGFLCWYGHMIDNVIQGGKSTTYPDKLLDQLIPKKKVKDGDYRTPSNIKVGYKVKKGELIGYVGSSGWTYGEHLHFECEHTGKNSKYYRFRVDNFYGPDGNPRKQPGKPNIINPLLLVESLRKTVKSIWSPDDAPQNPTHDSQPIA